MKNRHFFLTLVFAGASVWVGVLMLTSCRMEAPVITPEPSPTASQTLVPTATIDWFPRTATPTQTLIITPVVTSQPQDLPPGISTLLIQDDFSNTTLWSTIRSQSGNVVYGDNNLSLAVAGDKGSLSSLSQHNLPANFFLEMKVTVALCSPDDQYGITFWHQSDGSYHRLLLTCDGELRLERFSGGSGQVLHDWEYISRFMPGSPSQFQVSLWASQGELRVFVNDIFQVSTNTVKDLGGGLGVMARAGGETAETILFSDLSIYRVEP